MTQNARATVEAACQKVHGRDGLIYQQHSLRIVGVPGNRLVRFTLQRGEEIFHQLHYEETHPGAPPRTVIDDRPAWWRPTEDRVHWRPYRLNDPVPGATPRPLH